MPGRPVYGADGLLILRCVCLIGRSELRYRPNSLAALCRVSRSDVPGLLQQRAHRGEGLQRIEHHDDGQCPAGSPDLIQVASRVQEAGDA